MASLTTDDLKQKPRPDLTIFYVLDRSGSMAGQRDQVLDLAMRNTITELKKTRSIDSHLRVAVLEYDSSTRWLTSVPEYIEDFEWRGIASSRDPKMKQPGELSAPGGLTNIPEALRELDSKMSKNAFLDLTMGSYMPIIIFMTDGYINKQFVSQLQPALDELDNNLWFQRATKIGFAIGDDADKDVVISIVGQEGFNETTDLQAFAEKLVKVSVTASIINGSSRVVTQQEADSEEDGVWGNKSAGDPWGESANGGEDPSGQGSQEGDTQNDPWGWPANGDSGDDPWGDPNGGGGWPDAGAW